MRFIITLTLLLISSSFSFSQTHAITDKGEEVILNNDGTWKYANITPSYDTKVDTVVVTKDKTATFLVKSQKIAAGVWINPKKWKFEPYNGNATKAPVEYLFSMKGEDAYAMLITERVEATSAAVKELVISHAKEIDPNAHLTREEIRNVNGTTCYMLEYEASNKGLSFHYIGYILSSAAGTIQFLGFTTQNLVKKYKAEIEILLNGLTITKEK